MIVTCNDSFPMKCVITCNKESRDEFIQRNQFDHDAYFVTCVMKLSHLFCS